MSDFIVGSWYINGNSVYVRINKQGTVQKFNFVSGWTILKLAFFQFFGRMKRQSEVLDYLRKNNKWY